MKHWSEFLAAWYLQYHGLKLLDQNYRCRWGEIDLVMEDQTPFGGVLVFVEVRYRKGVQYGRPEDTVSRTKQKRIVLTANHYLLNHCAQERVTRFDVIAVTRPNYAPSITWIPEAFI